MKIAHFTDSFFSKNGVSTYVTVTAIELIKRGHQLLIVAPKYDHSSNEEEAEKQFNCQFVLLPSVAAIPYPDFRIAAPTPQSFLKLKKFNPDIIHLHTPGPVGLEGLLTTKALKTVLVSTFHTYFMEPEGFQVVGIKRDSVASPLLNRALWQLAAHFHKPCQAIIAPTKYVAKDLHSRWSNSRIETIPGGISVAKFAQTDSRVKLRRQYHIRDDEQVLLWVGRLSYEKNLDVLVEACALALETNQRIKLVMVGDGPARRSLEYMIKALELSDRVVITGLVSYQTLMDENLYALADLFVTASTYDTQGLSIIEAMAAGLPVIAPNVKAMPELVKGNGLLVKPFSSKAMASAINRLLGNHKLYQRYVKKAREKAQLYSVEKSVDLLEKLYEELLGEYVS